MRSLVSLTQLDFFPEETSPLSRANPTRLRSVDFVKGLAITLVVLGHVIQGMGHRHLWEGSGYNFTEHFIYSFHMPAFFFVSGIFIEQSIAGHGKSGFVVDKLRTVLYPYVLWTLLQAAISPFIDRFLASPSTDTGSYLLGAFLGDDSWFLYTLFFILVLAVLTDRIPITLRFVLAALLSIFWPVTGHRGIDGIFTEFVFVVGGQMAGRKIATMDGIHPWAATLAVFVTFGAMAAIVFQVGLVEIPKLWFIPLGLAGTAGIFFLAHTLRNTVCERWIAWIGEASLGVFLVHPYAQGLSRLVVTRVFHPTHLLPQILIPTIFATIIPAALYHFRKPLHIALLFELPKSSAKTKKGLSVQTPQ
jgi:fucose 4-O-acetylase-like acetyltransferase